MAQKRRAPVNADVTAAPRPPASKDDVRDDTAKDAVSTPPTGNKLQSDADPVTENLKKPKVIDFDTNKGDEQHRIFKATESEGSQKSKSKTNKKRKRPIYEIKESNPEDLLGDAIQQQQQDADKANKKLAEGFGIKSGDIGSPAAASMPARKHNAATAKLVPNVATTGAKKGQPTGNICLAVNCCHAENGALKDLFFMLDLEPADALHRALAMRRRARRVPCYIVW